MSLSKRLLPEDNYKKVKICNDYYITLNNDGVLKIINKNSKIFDEERLRQSLHMQESYVNEDNEIVFNGKFKNDTTIT